MHHRNFLKRKRTMSQHKSYNALRQGASHSHWNRSMSGVNIVAKSPYGFSLSLGETPLRGFSPRSTLCILCTQSVLKAPLFKKLFIFLRLRQDFERLWGQSGELLGPGRRKRRRRLSPQIRKWWISFFLKFAQRGR